MLVVLAHNFGSTKKKKESSSNSSSSSFFVVVIGFRLTFWRADVPAHRVLSFFLLLLFKLHVMGRQTAFLPRRRIAGWRNAQATAFLRAVFPGSECAAAEFSKLPFVSLLTISLSLFFFFFFRGCFFCLFSSVMIPPTEILCVCVFFFVPLPLFLSLLWIHHIILCTSSCFIVSNCSAPKAPFGVFFFFLAWSKKKNPLCSFFPLRDRHSFFFFNLPSAFFTLFHFSIFIACCTFSRTTSKLLSRFVFAFFFPLDARSFVHVGAKLTREKNELNCA